MDTETLTSKLSSTSETSPVILSSADEPERGRSRIRRPSNSLHGPNLRRRGYHTLSLPGLGKYFHVEKCFKLVRELGHGAYGTVISAQDEISGEHVAIKQVPRVFDKLSLAKRALREVTLLRHFSSHDNITGLIDMDVITRDFNEIYLFMEPMEADLHQIIRSEQILTSAHIQYFLYQILRGVKFIHSAGVIHRDLKPGNLLVNSDCELKICDFGLSRGYDEAASDQNPTYLTEYVATRWYRAPEIMLSFTRYGKAIDMWSVGCILGELLSGRPVFKGRECATVRVTVRRYGVTLTRMKVDQLNKIIDILGTPCEKTVHSIRSDRARKYVRSLPKKEPMAFSKIIPLADLQAIDLLDKTLQFDPDNRFDVMQALEHPWLATFHASIDEPECEYKFEKWKYIESLETLEDFREAIWNEVQDFRKEVRSLSFHETSLRAGNDIDCSLDDTPNQPWPATGYFDLINDDINERLERITLTTSNKSLSTNGVPQDATDPIALYGDVRRASLMKNSSSINTAEQVDARQLSTVEARSSITKSQTQIRPRSTFGGRLLRSLSTISVHEVLEDPQQLDPRTAMGRYIIEKSAADAPPSELPKEFG